MHAWLKICTSSVFLMDMRIWLSQFCSKIQNSGSGPQASSAIAPSAVAPSGSQAMSSSQVSSR